jgi:predicted membrane protein
VTTQLRGVGMKKAITLLLTILSVVIILDSINFGHAIMMFLLAGIVPGTSFALSAEQTLQLFSAALGFVFARVMIRLVTLAATRQSAQYSRPKAAALAK